MQRWFFLEDPENARLRGAGDQGAPDMGLAPSMPMYPPRKWLFRVRARDLLPDEVVCVTGSVPHLGSWYPEHCVRLEQEADSEVWSKVISIPDKEEVRYRYCVCVIVEPGLQVIVRNWEVNITPRIIGPNDRTLGFQSEPVIYGDFECKTLIDRGWLTKETTIQLKLTHSPLTIFRPKYANRKIFIKVTPVNLIRHMSIPKQEFDESLSTDTQDMVESPQIAFTEVACLNDEDCVFMKQGQFGKEFHDGEMMIFQSTVLNPANIAFLIDLYIYSSKAVEGDPPYHAGFSYLLPSVMQGSEGTCVLPVTSTKQRPLGQLTVEYLIIRPLVGHRCNMSVTYQRHWNERRSGLDVGHRGSGSSFINEPKNCAEVRENTIASMKTAIAAGADFVEFDVQLSKDLVPIIYHDFHVNISMKRKKDLDENDMLELPVKDLTHEQLRLLKVYHRTEKSSKNPRFFDEDLEEHQPFPTLQQLLEVLDPHVGFNIEIKWTMRFKNGSYELYNPYDVNIYIDTILDVVLKHGGARRIIFSCFNPDICSIIRMKQNKYPVLFLTQGETKKYEQYMDPRCWTMQAAIWFAEMIEMFGVNAHTEDILRDPSLVKKAKEANLVVFCWGDDNADPATIRLLKQLGLHGVIYDKIYQYVSKEVKESIFLVEARESQKELIRVAAESAEKEKSPPPPQPTQPAMSEMMLDVERIREALDDQVSTATSLTSLESTLSDYKKS